MWHGGPLQVPFPRSIPVEAAISRTLAGVVSTSSEDGEGLEQFKHSPHRGTYYLLRSGLFWHGGSWVCDPNAWVVV